MRGSGGSGSSGGTASAPTSCAIRSRSDRDPRGETVLFLAMWLLSSFVLFSAMVTKYHHYILPAIIPAGMLIGIALAQWWGPKRPVATA